MALTGRTENEIVTAGQPEEEVYVAKFTNGTYTQLKELAEFLKKRGLSDTANPLDVIRLGISFVVSEKEDNEETQ